jgi:hypothetical protein
MENSTSDPTGGVVDRLDPPRGVLNTAWPLAALALLLLILLRACVPAAPVTPTPATQVPATTLSEPAGHNAGRTPASEPAPTGR